MESSKTREQISRDLIKLLGWLGRPIRIAKPVIDDPTFYGVEFPYTHIHYPVRLGYSAGNLDELAIILEDGDAHKAVASRFVSSLDRVLASLAPENEIKIEYVGNRNKRKYENPYKWNVTMPDLHRYVIAKILAPD